MASLVLARMKAVSEGFPGGLVVKNLAASARLGFGPWAGKIPWRRKQQTTPVFLRGKSHEQKSLTGYSPWGRKELDMT